MLAVFETGGKQYCVRPGDVVKVEKLDAEGTITFDRVLLATDGTATHLTHQALSGAAVIADVLETAKQDKVLVFKKKRRNNYRRLNGHRQTLTILRIKDISLDGKKPKTAKADPKPKEGPTKAVTKAPAKSAPKSASKTTTSQAPQ